MDLLIIYLTISYTGECINTVSFKAAFFFLLGSLWAG